MTDYALQRNMSGGVNNWVQPRLVGENEVADLLNMDLTIPGELSRRWGFSSIHTGTDKCRGIGKYHTSDGTRYLVAAMYGDDNEFLRYNGVGVTACGTVAGDVTHWFEMGVAYDGTSTYDEALFVADGASDMTWYLGGVNMTSSAAPGTDIRCPKWFRNRLWFTTDGAPYTLTWSDYRNGASTASGGSVYINEGDGQIINAIAATPRLDAAELVVLKERSIYAVNLSLNFSGDTISTTDSYVRAITIEAGAFAPHTECWIGDRLYFLAHDGVRALQISGKAPLQPYTDLRITAIPVSVRVQTIIDRINWAQKSKFWGTAYDLKYYLCVALDAETEPSTQLVYDTRHNAWSVYDWPANALREVDFDSTPTLFLGRNADSGTPEIAEITETAYIDDASTQEGHFTTRAFDAGAPHFSKVWLWVELLYLLDANTSETLTLYTNRDGAGFDTYKQVTLLGVDHPALSVNLPFSLAAPSIQTVRIDLMDIDNSRDLQLKFSFNGSDGLKLYGYTTAYRIEGDSGEVEV